MKTFEWWQTIIAGIQTAVLIITVVVARNIGVRQTEIASKQAEISEKLLDREYAISAVLVFEPSTKHLLISNFGRTNIYLAGYGLDDLTPVMQQSPRLIPPLGSHYISTADFDNYILSR